MIGLELVIMNGGVLKLIFGVVRVGVYLLIENGNYSKNSND